MVDQASEESIDEGWKLYSFFNSSASYRVRIALGLKGMEVGQVHINLRSGAHRSADYLAVNPAGLVPALQTNSGVLTQSLAIIDHLDRIRPEPLLIPNGGPARDRVLEISQLIACEIHPLNNPRVLKRLTDHLKVNQADKDAWYAHWVHIGFESLEQMLSDDGGWCVGHSPTMADCYLVPQVANARRMKIDLAAYPRIMRIDELAASHPAFIRAAPQLQPDYVAP